MSGDGLPHGVDVRELTRSFGSVRAVRGISFTVSAGELVSILGPSGCGKTTTLRLIAGLEEIDSGTVQVGGRDMTRRPAYERDIGVVFQSYALFPHMSMYDNVAYGLRARRVPESQVRQRVIEMLKLVRLEEAAHRYPRELSGGQQQRVALARAIAPSPRLLLLDEPLSNLDAKLRLEMREEILRIQRQVGVTTLFVTHDQEEALSISDRLILMNEGIIEQVGTGMEVYEEPASPFVAGFVGQALTFEGTVTESVGDGRIIVTPDGLSLKVGRRDNLKVGLRVLMVVKHERIRFLEEGQSADNVINAVCQSRTYTGATARYRCLLPADRTVSVLTDPRLDQAGRGPGAVVRLAWDAGDSSIVSLGA